ncbi:hypothetical protein [Oerskovia turbata]
MTSLELEVTAAAAYAPRPGLTVLMDDDGAWFVAGRMRVRLSAERGSDLSRVLQELAPGGSISSVTLAERTGLDGTKVENVVTDLRRRGLIVATNATEQTYANQTYFSVTAGVSRRFGTPEAVRDRLASSTVRVVGGEEFSRLVRTDLVALGVVCETSVERTGVAPSAEEIVDDRVTILEISEADDCATVIASALAAGYTVLPVRFADRVEIGPLIRVDSRPCPRCLVRSWGQGEDLAVAISPASYGLAAGLVVNEVLAYLTDCQGVRTEQSVLCFDPATLETVLEMPIGDDLCARCGPGQTLDTAGRILWGYENYVSVRTAEAVRSRVTSREKVGELEDLAVDRDRLWTSPRIGLVHADEDVALPDRDGGGDGEALIARLLQMAVGRRSQRETDAGGDRWAPTGGGLGSVGAYVVLDEEMFGLPVGGVVAYDDQAHALEVARRTPVLPLWGADLSFGAPATNRLGWVVLVSSVERLRRKYGDFALRLGLLDGGVALMQLHLVARSVGCSVEIVPTPQATREMIGLGNGENVLQVVAVYGKANER